MLPDVKVNEILMKCGEPCNVLENSKLELQKKSKKKIRKPKKPAGKSENSEIVVPLKVDPQNSHNLRTMAGMFISCGFFTVIVRWKTNTTLFFNSICLSRNNYFFIFRNTTFCSHMRKTTALQNKSSQPCTYCKFSLKT